jgi:hypothetical protein
MTIKFGCVFRGANLCARRAKATAFARLERHAGYPTGHRG